MRSLLPKRAFRALLRDPGFAVTASLTLAVGIGLSTAVWTVSQALLVRELPVRDQDGLVVLWGLITCSNVAKRVDPALALRSEG